MLVKAVKLQMLMPDTSQPAVHKPFYRRIWFLSFVGLLVCLAGAAGLVYFWVIVRYEQKAEEFDLAKLQNLESASVIYDRYGQVYGKIFVRNREEVSLSQISPYLVAALISAEDNRFYEHRGIDFWGMVRAAFKNTAAGRIRQGASTLTQQLARNTFDLRDRTYDLILARMSKLQPDDELVDDLNVETLFDDPWIIVASAQTQWARRRKIRSSCSALS